ncbi:hypothetical protein V493_06131 [Pseudogymnoascus sp. VKM F-4281 (FW-2241)]|nr:hypothetical protein V493_06131 [Pseudogymnoascus sp. VKM F-4281 (FW-2241)]
MADGTVDSAISAIEAADLTAIEHKILVHFVTQAYEPNLAAREVLDRIRDDDRPVEETLRVLKQDWHKLVAIISRQTPFDASLKDLVARRDPSRCCVTPPGRQQLDEPEPTFIIPPALSKLVDTDETKHSFKSLLDAFMTPSRAARLKNMVSDRSDPGRLANALLLAPGSWDSLDEDAGKEDLKAAYIIFEICPEPYDHILLADRYSFYGPGSPYTITFQTEDPKQLPLPSPFLLKTHFKFATALHRFYVKERIAEGWAPLQSLSYFSRSTQLIARTLWLLVPKFLRITCYRHLLKRGKSTYGYDISAVVQQLPLGLYAKRCTIRAADNEISALRILERKAPSIPAPLIIDTFTDDSADWFIMTRVPGTRLENVLHRTSHAERAQLATDLSNILAQMHKIENTSPYRFGNVSGGPIYDNRLIDSAGPFNSEGNLNMRLLGRTEFMKYLMDEVPTAFSRSHDSVFTHGDLFFSNVLVDGGRLSGLVDWEGAGFMPAYWDFIKAMRTAKNDEAVGIYRRVWGHEFDVELKTEKWIWKVFPYGS